MYKYKEKYTIDFRKVKLTKSDSSLPFGKKLPFFIISKVGYEP